MPRRSARLAVLSLVVAASNTGASTPPEFATAVAAAAGEPLHCRDEFVRVAEAAEQDGLARRALYGAAVCAVAGGDREGAFPLLSRAVARGFHDLERFYDDPRLAPLRADRRWPALEVEFRAAVDRWQATLDPEIESLYRADREDRAPGATDVDAAAIAARDRARVEKVSELVAAGRARTPDDLFRAATVLLRSEDVALLGRAAELARLAAERDADLAGARALAAATLDRSLVASGRPQHYGTQTVRVDGRWELAPVDPATTDEERAAWDVPPLAELRRRVETMAPAAPPKP